MEHSFELIRKVVEDALEIGIHPQRVITPSGVIHDRTDYESGWNDASIKICEQVCEAFDSMDSLSPELAFLLSTDFCYHEDGKLKLLLNDTFYYACADYEIVLESEVPDLASLCRSYGYAGAVYWASKKRDTLPEIAQYEKMVEKVAEMREA